MNNPDPILKLALTPRKQSPEMAMLEWEDDNRRYSNRVISVMIAGIVMFIVLMVAM